MHRTFYEDRRLHYARVDSLMREAERYFRAMVALLALGAIVTALNALEDGEHTRGLWPMFASVVIWPEWRRRTRAVLTEHQDYIAWLKGQC